MNPSELLIRLREMIDTKSDVEKEGPTTESGQKWLAKAYALLRQADPQEAAQFEHFSRFIGLSLSSYTLGPIWNHMLLIIRRAIAGLELSVPNTEEKIYAPGEAYDVYRDLREIVGAAETSAFIIDTYINEEIFDLYFAKCIPTVLMRLLTKPPSNALKTVMAKFQRGAGVKFEARESHDMHDRVLFLDDAQCWVIGQSIKDAATRMPTYLVPIDAVTEMKKHYENIWTAAAVI